MEKMLELLIVLIFTSIACGYLWCKQRHQYWEKCRVPHLKSESLFFGNVRDLFFKKVSVEENDSRLYSALAPHRFGGFYVFSKPELYVRDPELIKRVLIKDFRHFHDHNSDVLHKNDTLSFHLFFLAGREWDILRRKLTPTFTSGKMKMMFELVAACAEKLEKVVEKTVHDQETVAIKDLLARYSVEVISSCAFGLEANSLQDTNSEFFVEAKKLFAPSLRRTLYTSLSLMSPKLLRILKMNSYTQRTKDFFTNLVNDTIKHRTEKGVVRNDFLHLLMNVQKDEDEETKHFDFNLAAQCFLFFIAGHSTSSTTLSFTLYELAENPNIQKELQEEIDRVLLLHDGKITYDNLNEMPFMDKVINETLRLFPVLPNLERLCTEDYCFPGTDFVLKKGVSVRISVQGLHRDPQYFPNPNVFNPENFSEEAKNSRPACTYLPFGDGPRNCIGMRFGLMQVKLALTTIMRKYTVTTAPQMKSLPEMKPHTIVTSLRDKILLKFNKRSEWTTI